MDIPPEIEAAFKAIAAGKGTEREHDTAEDEHSQAILAFVEAMESGDKDAANVAIARIAKATYKTSGFFTIKVRGVTITNTPPHSMN